MDSPSESFTNHVSNRKRGDGRAEAGNDASRGVGAIQSPELRHGSDHLWIQASVDCCPRVMEWFHAYDQRLPLPGNVDIVKQVAPRRDTDAVGISVFYLIAESAIDIHAREFTKIILPGFCFSSLRLPWPE